MCGMIQRFYGIGFGVGIGATKKVKSRHYCVNCGGHYYYYYYYDFIIYYLLFILFIINNMIILLIYTIQI